MAFVPATYELNCSTDYHELECAHSDRSSNPICSARLHKFCSELLAPLPPSSEYSAVSSRPDFVQICCLQHEAVWVLF